MKRISALFLVAFVMSGCATGEGARWVGSENEVVQVEGIPYQVQYVRDASGFDTRTIRAEPIVVMPDMMIEQRRSATAALMVIQKQCPGAIADQPQRGSGMLTTVRVRCG